MIQSGDNRLASARWLARRKGEREEQTQERRHGGNEEEGPFDDGVQRGREDRAAKNKVPQLPARRASALARHRKEVAEGAPARPDTRQPEPFQQDKESGGHAVFDM